MENIVIVSGSRTAIGSFNGSLKDYKARELGGMVIKDAVHKAGLTPQDIGEVVFGCVGQAAEDAFIARTSSILAGIPHEATALTVNRLCSSGLQAIVTAAMELREGFCDIAVAGGVESMTNLPFYLRKARNGYRMGHGELEDGLITALSDPLTRDHMGITAENVAKKYAVTREDQDIYAAQSQQKAEVAIKAGVFKDEIVPVTVKVSKTEERIFDTDEYCRFGTTAEKLAKLRPAFKKDGTVTAGNSSGINDGAAAVVMMTEAKAKSMGLSPIVRIAGFAVAGVDPALMGIGPVPAVQKLVEKTGIPLEKIGLIELNEAFASQSIACIRELGLNPEIINVNGSGISLGHPIGATGCIITIKLMNEMKRRGVQYGLATLCIGGGQGLAVLFELCQ